MSESPSREIVDEIRRRMRIARIRLEISQVDAKVLQRGELIALVGASRGFAEEVGHHGLEQIVGFGNAAEIEVPIQFLGRRLSH